MTSLKPMIVTTVLALTLLAPQSAHAGSCGIQNKTKWNSVLEGKGWANKQLPARSNGVTVREGTFTGKAKNGNATISRQCSGDPLKVIEKNGVPVVVLVKSRR